MDPAAIIGVLAGTISTLVGVIVYFYRQHVAADDRREAERDKREAALVAERDAWLHRWEAADARLDRVSNAWLQAFREPAPQ